MKRYGLLTLLVSWLLLAGCVSTPLRETQTPTPDVMHATVAALQTENAQLATQVAGIPATIVNLPTATPSPSATPTATLPTATSTPTVTPTATPTHAVVHRPVPTATSPWPQILWLTANPGEVDPGQSVTLSWSASNATRAVIQQYSAANASYPELNVAPNGSVVLPIADWERLHHTFVLVAYNAAGNNTSNSVDVFIRCPYTYFFPLPPENYHWECPAGPATPSDAAEQYFEGGRMIWLGTEKHIYALLNDGGLFAYADTWTAGQPNADPGITPPPGRYTPVRGFGKVWSSDPYIRSRLGWAMGPEQGYQTQWQRSWTCCSAAGALYVRELDQRITRLWSSQSPSGSWEFTPY